MEKYILSVTVQNNAGVLARVSSLFGRRGYNIDLPSELSYGARGRYRRARSSSSCPKCRAARCLPRRHLEL